MTPEQEIQARAFLAIGSHPAVRVWRNNTGTAWQGENPRRRGNVLLLDNPRPITFGLCVGSSDAIGLRSVVITPADVGRTLAIFVAAEFKTAKGRATPEQTKFLSAITRAGGIAGIVRNDAEAKILLSI